MELHRSEEAGCYIDGHHNVLKQVNEFPIQVNDAPGLQINLNGSLPKR